MADVPAGAQFRALTRGSYTQLLDATDHALLPMLGHFQELSSSQNSSEPAPHLTDVQGYYTGLIVKYLPDGCLQF